MILWKRIGSIISMAALAVLLGAPPATAQARRPATAQTPTSRASDGYANARRLGGATSFYKPALTNTASVTRMAKSRGMDADVRKVLTDSGIPEVADKVIAMLANTSTSVVMGGSCADAAPLDGTLVECDFAPGGTLE